MFISGRRKTSRSRELIVVVGKDGGHMEEIPTPDNATILWDAEANNGGGA
jgi:hypothetical protein